MTPLQLTPAQHAILAKAINTSGGKIVWFPDNIKGGARKKVLDGMFNRALITPDGGGWCVAAEGYDALGMARPHAQARRIGSIESKLDEIIAHAEGAPSASDNEELEADVAAAEAEWTQDKTTAQTRPRTRENSKQAQVIAMLRRPEGATIAQICEATGWQKHTVRGTFAGAFKKKLGLTIPSEKPDGGERVYRIA